MRVISKALLALVTATTLATSSPQPADGAIYVRRVAPVRRVAARAVLPPYPVARRAVVGPVYRPYAYRPYVGYGGYGGYGYGGYGGGVSVWW